MQDDGSDRDPANPPDAASLEREAHRATRSKKLVTVLAVGALSTAAAVGSIVGSILSQGIAYRQMRAIESIAESIARGGTREDARVDPGCRR